MRAGLFLHADVEYGIGLAGQAGLHAAGERHQFYAQAFDDREDGEDFLSLAGIGNREHDVHRRDHADIAVRGLAGVNEERRRAGAGEGSRDLAADMSALAHAGDDHASLTGKHQFAGLGELPVQTFGERVQRIGFELDHFASQLLERDMFSHVLRGLAGLG